jgi:hypothetical protein
MAVECWLCSDEEYRVSPFGFIIRPTISRMIVSTGMYITRFTTFYCLQLTQNFSCNRQSVLES